MDTTDPWIRFDPKGYCNHCSDFLTNRLAVTAYRSGERAPSASDSTELERMFARLRRQRSPEASHDVLVGVSGGVDSTQTALLAQQAGLRVLAVHMDNGWDTPIALQNVYQLAQISGIDYQAEVLHWNQFKAVQRAFIDAGVPDIELPTDIAIQAVLHRVASRHRIRTILSGGNISNEGILPISWMYNPRDSRYAQAIIAASGLDRRLYDPLKFGFRQELRARLVSGIRTLYPLNQFAYDKEAARTQLTESIGWQSYGGKHCESTFTRFCQLIYHPRRHRIDYRRGYLSADICLGRRNRQHALDQLAAPAWTGLDVKHDVAFVARKLDYSPDQLESAMQAPPLWFCDFPHRQRFLGLAYNSFRLLTGRRKASNF